jgi:DNA modification methylase
MKGENKKFGKSSKAFNDHDWLANHGKPHPQMGLTWVKGDREFNELDETSQKNLLAQPSSGTSIFDPVLCELIYRWFCPPKGSILDPFAGGSVRGIVAGYLGYNYKGIELRQEQIDANLKNILDIKFKDGLAGNIKYICGDSLYIDALTHDTFDLIFSCPPYYDLEVYSNLPGELSAFKTYPEFISNYNLIINKCVKQLKDNRFACFVVGDVRDKAGYYHNFVSDTITAFQSAGMRLYNEAILITAVGSLPIRVSRAFQSNRKLGKTHQNVLVFYKGDIKQIKTIYGEVECGEAPEAELVNG